MAEWHSHHLEELRQAESAVALVGLAVLMVALIACIFFYRLWKKEQARIKQLDAAIASQEVVQKSNG